MNGPLDPSRQKFAWIDKGFMNGVIIFLFIILVIAVLINAQIHEPYYANYIAGGV